MSPAVLSSGGAAGFTLRPPRPQPARPALPTDVLEGEDVDYLLWVSRALVVDALVTRAEDPEILVVALLLGVDVGHFAERLAVAIGDPDVAVRVLIGDEQLGRVATTVPTEGPA